MTHKTSIRSMLHDAPCKTNRMDGYLPHNSLRTDMATVSGGLSSPDEKSRPVLTESEIGVAGDGNWDDGDQSAAEWRYGAELAAARINTTAAAPSSIYYRPWRLARLATWDDRGKERHDLYPGLSSSSTDSG